MPLTETLTPDSVVAWHAEQITATVDSEVVVLGLIRGQYVGLDDIGSTVWTLLEQPRTVRQLCAELEMRYQGNSASIMADALEFLQELRALDLVRTVDTVPATGQ